MEYEILTRSLKDSAADSKLKLLKDGETFGVEKPGGEKRIHIGSISENTRWDSFFFPKGGQTFNVTVSKIDLIKYLLEAKDEYLNPHQSYRLKISDYYDDLYKQTLDIPDESFQVCFEKNTDDKRYYLTRPSGNVLSKNYNYIINICLPIVTQYVFLRVKDGDSYIFYLRPEFKPNFTTPDLIKNNSAYEDHLQQIFYGAPGTGKSREVKKQTGELLDNDEERDLPNVFRTTFHPDTDYASFVGCYKPTMKPTSAEEKTLTGKDEEIVYEFVPQVFTDAYVYAYNNPDQATYLVIEEINRGNCAQIFGDLFQLLDRKNGISEYKIKADKDLANYLIDKLGEDSEGINEGKLCLPSNLNILATMNTSDQSLFPMDSAFKRRWEWEYVPINYGIDIKSGTFKITIGGKTYLWVDFIEKANKKIFDLTQSEDKQLGNFFIKCSIDEKEFKSKVMFYLWYEVLRDETENNKYFFKKKTTADDKDQTSKFTFKDLYASDASETLQQFMAYLEVSPK